jgi:hypothetical protein
MRSTNYSGFTSVWIHHLDWDAGDKLDKSFCFPFVSLVRLSVRVLVRGPSTATHKGDLDRTARHVHPGGLSFRTLLTVSVFSYFQAIHYVPETMTLRSYA